MPAHTTTKKTVKSKKTGTAAAKKTGAAAKKKTAAKKTTAKKSPNAYIKKSQEARKKGLSSFEYNGKKYYAKKTKTGMVVYSLKK